MKRLNAWKFTLRLYSLKNRLKPVRLTTDLRDCHRLSCSQSERSTNITIASTYSPSNLSAAASALHKRTRSAHGRGTPAD